MDQIERLFDIIAKGGHEGLQAVQETVNRNGKTFQETFWEKTGQELSTERTPQQEAMAPSKILDPKGKSARAPKGAKQEQSPEQQAVKRQKEYQQAVSVYDGKLPSSMSTEEHVQVATQVLDQHSANLETAKARLKSMAPPGAVIQGRVKDLSSTLGKLVRKPKYGNATTLQDLTGMRVLCNTQEEQLATVAQIKANYKVVTEDDYLTKPQGLYRAYHLIVEDQDGFQKEVQVQTQAQQNMQLFLHDLYKPLTPQQEAAVTAFKDDLDQYANAAFQYTAATDTGLQLPKPECPAVVAALFNCV